LYPKYERRMRKRLHELAMEKPIPNSGKVRQKLQWLVRKHPPLILEGTLTRSVYSGDETITYEYIEV